MQTIQVNGTQIAYSQIGSPEGTPVVLSHSLFFDHSMFATLAGILSDNGYRVISYDQRGQGASAPSSRADLSVDNLTEDAAALIRKLGLGRVHAAGNSLGGFVTLRLAARHPELLISAAAMGSSAEEEHQLDAFAPLVDHLIEHGAGDVVDTLMHIMFGDATLAAKNDTTQQWRAFMSNLGPVIGDCAYQVIHRGRIIEELAGCAVPVLAIAGVDDHAYPPPISSANIAAATGGQSVTLDNAGHSVSLEQPEGVAEQLWAHVARAEAR